MGRRDARLGARGREAASIRARVRHRVDANRSATAEWDAWGDARRDAGEDAGRRRALAGADAEKLVDRGWAVRARDVLALLVRLDRQVRPA